MISWLHVSIPNASFLNSAFPNRQFPDPDFTAALEGCIPGPGLKGLGQSKSAIGVLSRDYGIRDNDVVGKAYIGIET